MSTTTFFRKRLRGGAALGVLALFGTGVVSVTGFASTAAAQTADQQNCADVNADGTCDTEQNQSVPATPAAPAAGQIDNIVVTGTRIKTPEAQNAVPVQVIGAEQLESTGTVNVQEALLQNPVFGAPTYSRNNSAFNTSSAGAATIDLRNLGIDRTLVLINGRRVVSGIPGSSAVDINMIPTAMLERVETLTSGSGSAIYGSDAVAGVVNFILKDDFEGLELGAQTGVAETGDNFTLDTHVMLGGNFADGRGNATVFFGYTEQGAAYKRNHYTEEGRSNLDSFYGDTPFERDQPFYSSYAPQGRYTAGDYTFTYGPDGQLQPCFATNAASCSNALGTGTGPNGFNRTAYRYLAVPVQRYLMNLNAHYDVTDSITAFVEGAFESTHARSEIEPFPFDTDSPTYSNGQQAIETRYNGGIVRNPFVPDAIYNAATDTDDDGLKDIFIAKRLADFGPRTSESTNNVFRMVGGLRGDISSNWSFEAFANYGESNISQTGSGQINILNYRNSQQIVPDGVGGYQCANPDAVSDGCVPVNVFGPNSFDAAAIQYLQAPQMYNAVQKQTQIGGNITGSVNSLWGANPIGLTVGTEYRRESQSSQWDALQAAGLNGGNALPPTKGSFDLYEFYGETLVPLISNSFVYDLSIRGAARYSHYSTVGNTFSWNAGAEFAPIQDIRFRGMYAVTVRAPNISELFAGRSQDFPTVTDPCVGIGATGGGALGENCRAAPGVLANIAANGTFTLTQSDIQGVTSFSGGNPNLQEEKGKTLTAGVLINPRSIDALRNLTITADYFRVKIEDAIVGTPLPFILNQCYQQGRSDYCDFIVRRSAPQGLNSAGSLDEVNTAVTNSGGLQTSGIDVTVNYVQGLDIGSDRYQATFHAAYTHLFTGYSRPLPGADKDRFGGEVGAATDRFTINTGLGNSDWKLTLNGTYVGPSYLDDQTYGYKEWKVHSEFYLGSQVRFFVTDAMEMYVGADNLLNNKPMYFGGTVDATTGQDTNTGVYDPIGRRFYAGAKLRF
ncbi:MAG: TonB-dependent receptor [Sphingomonas sp.]|uniref:TonB-dependent receptor domain-containing protein n=1 Tax=Stakelama pacifica TaxID=517720 RepID=UPI000C45768D|nr:TonB-dependent receptor [Stakelama pacifica]MAW99391.1 TonB-dependent receptor [Sphingomonas sp.]GGO98533.1 TonB-dependent receptor [Stakelama pacifica]